MLLLFNWSLPAPVVSRPAPAAQSADVVDDDTEQAILLLWARAGDLTPLAPVDDDTEAAILELWQHAGDLAVSLPVDDDTEQAILDLWETDMQLSQLFKSLPRTGRLKSTQPGQDVQATGPYVVLDCKLDGRQAASTTGSVIAYHDRRRVSLTVYGTRADVVQGVGLIRALFTATTTLSYPSGARFLMWQPLADVQIEEDDDTKAGRDVWKGTVEAIVWSVRQG